jgi:hypothetical protein
MSGILGHQRQLLARLLADANANLPAERHKLFQPGIVPLLGHENVVKTPPSSLERLLNRVHPVQNFHEQ